MVEGYNTRLFTHTRSFIHFSGWNFEDKRYYLRVYNHQKVEVWITNEHRMKVLKSQKHKNLEYFYAKESFKFFSYKSRKSITVRRWLRKNISDEYVYLFLPIAIKILFFEWKWPCKISFESLLSANVPCGGQRVSTCVFQNFFTPIWWTQHLYLKDYFLLDIRFLEGRKWIVLAPRTTIHFSMIA